MLSRWRMRPRQTPERLAGAFERAHREAALTRLELGALTPRRGARAARRAVDRRRGGALRRERRQPVLPRAARALARARGRSAPPLPGVAGRHRGPAGGRRRAGRGARAAVRDRAPACSRERRWRATRSSPSWRRPRRRRPRRRRSTRSTSCCGSTSFARPTCPAASASGTRSSAGRSTRPRRGGWRLGAHERCADALAARGASAAARAHHVERSARQGDAAAVAILREAGEAAAQRAPASAARWFAAALRLLPRRAPAQERVELLLARAGALAATGQFAESHAALLESIELVPDESPRSASSSRRRAPGSSSCLGRHEQAHARLVSALDGLPRPGLGRGGGAA